MTIYEKQFELRKFLWSIDDSVSLSFSMSKRFTRVLGFADLEANRIRITWACFKYTIEAFNASEESRTPVILLSDALLSRLYELIDTEKIQFRLKPRRFKPLGDNKRHFTGLLSEDGIPRTRDTKLYRKWIKEMKTEIETVANRYNFYEYLENDGSDTLIISFGIASRVISSLKEKYSLFRPIRIFPILENEIKKAAEKHDKVVVLEMNYGQYKNEIERVLKRDVHSINPVGGRIELKEIREELNGI